MSSSKAKLIINTFWVYSKAKLEAKIEKVKFILVKEKIQNKNCVNAQRKL
jgi:hypothetical protein